MQVKLMFLGTYDFSPKDKPEKSYKIYQFVDLNSLQVIVGTDLNVKLKEEEYYNCLLELKGNKLRVKSVQ